MLRWAVARVPLRPEEKARLDREEFEAQGFVTNMERLLVAADESAGGRFASRLAGLLAGSRRLPTTILRSGPETAARQTQSASPRGRVETVARASARTAQRDTAEIDVAPPPVDITTRSRRQPVEEAVAQEAKKGYDLLVIGVEKLAEEGVIDEKVARIAAEFDGPFAIAAARGAHRRAGFSRHGAEVALALAHADYGTVTALYVTSPGKRPWQREFRRALAIGGGGAAVLREIVALGDRMEVAVRTAVRTDIEPAQAILRQLRAGRHNLLVMGVSSRPGATLSFGAVAAAVLAQSERSVLFVSS